MSTGQIFIYTLILIVIYCSFTPTLNIHESFKTQMTVNERAYDKYRFIYLSDLDTDANKFELIPLPLPLEHVPNPPKNSSSQAVGELEHLVELAKSAKDDEINMALKDAEGHPDPRIVGDPVLDLFIKYAGENSLIYSEKYLKTLARESDIFARRLKYIYARPRPHQLAFLYQKTLPIKGACQNLNSASYPSGSVLKAKLLALALKHNNQDTEISEKLDQIVKRIALSRQILGLNFESDISVTDNIVKTVSKYLRYFDPTL